MIRLRFKKGIDYQRFRYEYALRAVASHAVLLDPEPLLKFLFRGLGNNAPLKWDKLKKCLPSHWPRPKKEGNDNLKRINESPFLKQLLLKDRPIRKRGSEDKSIPGVELDPDKVIAIIELFAGPERKPTWWDDVQTDLPLICELRCSLESKLTPEEYHSYVVKEYGAWMSGAPECSNEDLITLGKLFSFKNLCDNAVNITWGDNEKNPFMEEFPIWKDDPDNQSIPTTYWLIQQIDIEACPYCNMQYTPVIPGARIRPALDHFFPKSNYPHLAINLFNLIPTCDTCNGKKSNNGLSVIYPYEEAFDSFRYGNVPVTVEPKPTSDLLAALQGRSDELEINFDIPRGSSHEDDEHFARIEHSIEQYKLGDRYNDYIDVIKTILENHYIYSAAGIKERLLLLLNEKSDLQSIPDSINGRLNSLLYFADMMPERWGNAPLNKMKSDIVRKLDYWEYLGEEEIKRQKGERYNG